MKECAFWAAVYLFVRRNAHLQRYRLSPLKFLIAAGISKYVLGRLLKAIGLLPSAKPGATYHPNFRFATKVLAALDAGTLATQNVPTKLFRDVASTFMYVYYLCNPEEARQLNDRFRENVSIQMIRRCFEKGRHPVLNLIGRATRPRLGMDGRHFQFSRCDGGPPVSAYLYFRGSDAELAEQTGLVLSFPGGGFVAMSPRDHSDYLCEWAHQTGLPVLSVDYRKAPEYPYPCALDDCFAVYRSIIETNGSAIGMNQSVHFVNDTLVTPVSPSRSDVKVVLVGDSGGGNLCAAAALRALRLGIRSPAGVNLIYPCLNFDIAGFRLQDNKFVVASQATYINDCVLPYAYLIECARSYLSNGGDPVNDCEISPLRASDKLLSQFPPTFIHYGTFDPLNDDSKLFARRLKAANPRRFVQLEEIDGYSHGYLHIQSICPEARAAHARSGEFFKRQLYGKSL